MRFSEQDIRRIAGNVHENFEESLACYKSADQSVTNTTLTSDTALTVTLENATNYLFHYFLYLSNGGAGEGAKLALSGTTTAGSFSAKIAIYDLTTPILATISLVTALDSAVGVGLSSGTNYAEILGSIETTIAGSFLIQFAQNATGASAGVTIKRGSAGKIEKLE